MKKETRSLIKSILRANADRAKSCLYPENDYAWGTKPKNLKATLALMNDICEQLPDDAWPNFGEEKNDVSEGDWRIALAFDDVDDGKVCRFADLKYKRDDHTAWVYEDKNGKWKDFDIGGS